jgi:uncharacterized protein YndB with AHSA1/START domain/ribosomal protein S18 acetylase RimI-like enzyme
MTEVGSSDSGEMPAQAGEPAPGQEQTNPRLLNLTANVPDERMFSWHSQAAQYAPTGPPGFSYVRGQVTDELFVDCLLYRDETGGLVGILNRYPTDFPPLEREGDQNIWVHPDHRRQGIGSALVSEAFSRWGRWGPVGDTGDLKLTQSGVQLVQGMENKRSIVQRVLPAPPDVAYDSWLDAEGMCHWMCARPAVPTHIEIDPRVGGQYRIDIDDEGLGRSVTGRYLVLNGPDGMVFTWYPSTWDPSIPESAIMVQLEPHDEGRTLMTIRHGRLPDGLRDDYEAVWRRIAAQLEEYLAGRCVSGPSAERPFIRAERKTR